MFSFFKKWNNYLNENHSYIKKSDYMKLFQKDHPLLSKINWFVMEREDDYWDHHFEYNGVIYKSLDELCEKKPDQDKSVFIGFNYLKKSDLILVKKD